MPHNKKHFPITHQSRFLAHLMRNTLFGLLFIALGLAIGMLGYHHFEQMSWVDAFANASMILSGMGPFGPLHSFGGKIFAGFYALFSGLAFIAIVVLIFAPVVHRFFRKLHLDDKNN